MGCALRNHKGFFLGCTNQTDLYSFTALMAAVQTAKDDSYDLKHLIQFETPNFPPLISNRN